MFWIKERRNTFLLMNFWFKTLNSIFYFDEDTDLEVFSSLKLGSQVFLKRNENKKRIKTILNIELSKFFPF